MSALHEALAALADANDIRLGKSGAASYTGIGSDAIRALLAEHPPTPAPEGTERVEWGMRWADGFVRVEARGDVRRRALAHRAEIVRRTITEFAPVVGEWEPVEETQPVEPDPAMRAFVAGWFAHARNRERLLVEDAWRAYRDGSER